MKNSKWIAGAALAAAIVDWIDSDDLAQPNGAEIDDYEAVGLSYGPKNAPFDTVSELQQVLGMNYELYSKIEPSITIYSGRSDPNIGFADVPTLMAAGCTEEQARLIVELRQSIPPGDPAANTIPGCDGVTPIVAGGGGLTYSVESRARLPNGASTTLDATIRMGGVNAAGRPYVILRWRDGESS